MYHSFYAKENTMKKRILCLVLALVLVGSAVGFFVYDKVGNTFNYAKKSGKYLTIGGKDYVNALYTGGKTEPAAVDETALRAAVAKALASLQKTVGTDDNEVVNYGTIRLYDTLYVKYYATIGEGADEIIITKPETADPSKSNSVQLGADDDLARIFLGLIGKNASLTSYRTAKSDSKIYLGDTIVFKYTIAGAGGEDRENLKTVVSSTEDFLKAVETKEGVTGLTAKFLAAVKEQNVKVGDAVTLTVGEGENEKTFDITVQYALRDWIIGGALKDGDYVRLVINNITKDDEGKDVIGKDTDYTGRVTKADLDAEFGDGFYDKLMTVKIGEKTEEKFSAVMHMTDSNNNKYDETKEYMVKVVRVEGGRENAKDLPANERSLGESYLTVTKTYDADSDAKADNDENLSLAGKTVTYHIAITDVKTCAYDYANITDDKNGLKYSVKDADSALAKLFKVYDALTDAQKAYDDAKDGDLSEPLKALNEAKAALLDAEIAYIETLDDSKVKDYLNAVKALEDAKKALEDATDKTDALREAVTKAEEALAKALADGNGQVKYYAAVKTLIDAKKALADAEGLEGEDAKNEEEMNALREAVENAETAATATLNAYADEKGIILDNLKYVDIAARDAYEKQETKTLEDENKDKLAYEIAKEVWNKILADAGKDVKYPGKAVRIAYRGLMDGYKTNYYENREKEPYSNYKTFKDYLKNGAYAGKDYKAELTKEAEEIVLEQLVLYRLVDLYEIKLTANQESILKIYQQIGATSYIDSMRTAYLFDNLMQRIAEDICPAVAKD